MPKASHHRAPAPVTFRLLQQGQDCSQLSDKGKGGMAFHEHNTVSLRDTRVAEMVSERRRGSK